METENIKPDDMTESCKTCTGQCCRYITVPFGPATTEKQFDDMRWYLSHEDVCVFEEKELWYVSIKTVCKYLAPDTNICLNYEDRPQICRDFDPAICEHNCDRYGFDLQFYTDKEMKEYIKLKFDNDLTPKGKANKEKKRAE